VLIGIASGTASGFGAALSYFAAYSIAALGVFLAVGIEHPQDAGDVDGLEGLSSRRPLVAVALAAFTLSLVGIPPFVGFFGKLGLFSAAIAAGSGWLAVVGLVFSVVSLGYYGTLLRATFLSDAQRETPRIPRVGFAGLPVGALAGLTALMALSPGMLFVVTPS
jgi:NADH-quinone oxidoreductase subunit N